MRGRVFKSIAAILFACVLCAGCGEAGLPPGEPVPDKNAEQYVTDFFLGTTSSYTGYIKNGRPNGEGAIRYRNGNRLTGTFADGQIVYGTFTYASTMSYTGEFQNGKFHGQGTFDWRKYDEAGNVTGEGWLYEGEFKNGSPAGCVGKTTFIRIPGRTGVYWFEGEMDGFPSVKPDQTGKGCIRYADRSEYVGDLYYTAEKKWLRYGWGEQNFFGTAYKGADAGYKTAPKIWSYAGEFDALENTWMYGNGVVYFCDESQTPIGYIRGSWNGLDRVGEWQGTWSEDDLLQAWRNTEELPYQK